MPSEQWLRQVDALVAEHVMGWRWFKYSFPPVQGTGGSVFQSEPFVMLISATADEPDWCPSDGERVESPGVCMRTDTSEVPNYTTDGNAMLEVLNELTAHEKGDNRTHLVWWRTYGQWVVTVGDADADGPTTNDACVHKSLPLAVALAALKAVNVDVPEDQA